jgi:hypothetical protein
MRVSVIRKNVKFIPDSSRIVARYFMSGDLRTQYMLSHVMTLDENQVIHTLEQTLRQFARRHRNISSIFYKSIMTASQMNEKCSLALTVPWNML